MNQPYQFWGEIGIFRGSKSPSIGGFSDYPLK